MSREKIIEVIDGAETDSTFTIGEAVLTALEAAGYEVRLKPQPKTPEQKKRRDDWADEIADTLVAGWWKNTDDMGYDPNIHQIAAALRKAKQDGRDEAAQAAGRPNEDGSWTNSCNCRKVLRALKDKSP